MKKVNFYLNFTVSKLVAIVILIMSFTLDLLQNNSSFEIALPFIVMLITGKQIIDYKSDRAIKNNDYEKA